VTAVANDTTATVLRDTPVCIDYLRALRNLCGRSG
jgi:hypothetical protein